MGHFKVWLGRSVHRRSYTGSSTSDFCTDFCADSCTTESYTKV